MVVPRNFLEQHRLWTAVCAAGGLIGLVGEGLRAGKLGIRGGYVHQRGTPLFFWGCSVLYIIIALVIFYGFIEILFEAA